MDSHEENDFDQKGFQAFFSEKLREAVAEVGHFNLVLFGKTGVGKSTLVNAMFGSSMAATGNGRPVTDKVYVHEQPGNPLRLFDTRGFEVGDDQDHIIGYMRSEIEKRRSGPVGEQIHAVWYCVRASDRRFEDSQATFVESFHDLGLPVILVMTQVGARPLADESGLEIHHEALELATDIEERGLPISPEKRVVLTNAKADEWRGEPVHGLDDLLEATFRVVPEGVRAALTAAQIVDLERKREQARKVIRTGMAAAGAAAAVPIPFADAAIIVPVQVVMMARISVVYGMSVSKATAAAMASQAFLQQGVGFAAKAAVRTLLRWIPGVGVAAGAVQASIAVAFTYAVGEAWRTVSEKMVGQGDDTLADYIAGGRMAEDFLKAFRNSAKQQPPS